MKFIQENIVSTLQGTEGKYILVRQSQDRLTPYTFQVDRSLDTSLKELVNRILPICNDYSTVMHFIEDKSSFEFGVVNHALCGAMRTLVKVCITSWLRNRIVGIGWNHE